MNNIILKLGKLREEYSWYQILTFSVFLRCADNFNFAWLTPTVGVLCLKNFSSLILSHTTKNRIILTKQSGRVPKNLTASRILQILIALCQIKAKIHSFPTMYIIGGGKFGLTRWKKCLKPKRSPKNSCFGGNESQLHNFGRVWDPNFLRWPQFGGYPRKATCLSFKMSYVQGP